MYGAQAVVSYGHEESERDRRRRSLVVGELVSGDNPVSFRFGRLTLIIMLGIPQADVTVRR